MSSQPIQAGATTIRPFGDIIAENGDSWTGLDTPKKLDVLNAYIDNRKAKDPAFSSLNEKQVKDVKVGYVSKFILKQADENLGTNSDLNNAPPTQTGSPLDAISGLSQGLGQAGQFLFKENPLQAVSGLGKSVQNLVTGNTQGAEQQLKQYNTVQDPTRLPEYQNNPYFKGGVDVGSTAGNLASYTLGGALGPLGIAGVAANKNLQQANAGQQNYGQAAYNTALDAGLGMIAPQAKGLIPAAAINAGVGAIGGAAGYAGNQALTGQQINPLEAIEAAKRSALEGGVIGAGFHAANARPATPQIQAPEITQPLYKGRPVTKEAPVSRVNTKQADTAAKDFAKQLMDMQRKGRGLEARDIKRSLPVQMQDRVNLQMSKVKASEKQAAKNKSLKEKQAAQSNKALTKAEQENRDRELRQLKAVIKENNSNPTEENPLKAEIQNDTPDQHRENLQKAIDAGKAVRLDYRAERAGSRDESTFRQKFDKPYELGTDNSGDYVRVVNENGKFSKRYLDSIKGTIETSSERFPYSVDNEGTYARGARKGERGRARVLDEDGNEVDQSSRELTKDSVIEGNIQKMQDAISRAKQGKASVKEILDASRGLSEADFAKATKGLSQEQINKIGKDIGC